MASVFVFAEQVRSIVRSGQKVIEIPEGARISAAAADLIKEHQIQVQTVAPGSVAADELSEPDIQSTQKVPAEMPAKPAEPPVEENRNRSSSDKTPAFSKDELEEIVNRVVARFRQLKGDGGEKTDSETTVQTTEETETSPDGDDLVICRCEEITRGEIKAAILNGIQTLNGVKRVTRAGMGLCQGQTCQQLVARLLAEELGINAADIDPTTARGPVRPLRLEVFANS